MKHCSGCKARPDQQTEAARRKITNILLPYQHIPWSIHWPTLQTLNCHVIFWLSYIYGIYFQNLPDVAAPWSHSFLIFLFLVSLRLATSFRLGVVPLVRVFCSHSSVSDFVTFTSALWVFWLIICNHFLSIRSWETSGLVTDGIQYTI